MKKWFALAGIGSLALGIFWHGLYGWFPERAVGLFAPVNGSVFEQLKLLFWPFLPAVYVLGLRFGQARIWNACCASLLALPAAALGAYYSLHAGFGLDGRALGPVLYLLLGAGGFFLAYRLAERNRFGRWSGVFPMLAGIYGSALVLFSVAAPPLPLFFP